MVVTAQQIVSDEKYFVITYIKIIKISYNISIFLYFT